MTDPSPKEPAQPFLIVIGGPRDGDTLNLESPGLEKILGSGPDCHLRLEASHVQPRHARIVWEEGRGVFLSDEGTATGTFVNGETVSPHHLLQDGDRVCLGPPGSAGTVKLLVRAPAPSPLPHGLLADAEPDLVHLDTVLEAPVPTGTSAPSPGPPAADEDIFDAAESDRLSQPPPSRGEAENRASPKTGEGRRAGREDLTQVPSIVLDVERPTPVVATPVTDTALEKLARQAARRRLPRGVAIAVIAVTAGLGLLLSLRFLLLRPPVLTVVVPPKVEPGGAVTLTGSGFDASPGKNTVRVGKVAAEVSSASSTQLAVRIPTTVGAPPLDLPLTVQTRGGRSNALFVKVRAIPQAQALDPEVALPGESVSLRGHQLAGKSLALSVDGLRAEVQAAEASVIRFKVPEVRLVEGRTVSVNLQVGEETARPLTLTLGRLPLVTEITPSKGPPGERVVLKGFGFDPSRSGNLVTFGDEPAVLLSASEKELVVAAPFQGEPQTQAALPVLVKARGRVSSGSSAFSLWRQSAGIFRPRFFVAPVPGDAAYEHVFVSSELGPALLLSHKDDATTTAERAVRVATGLNALFEEAASRPLQLEVREDPSSPAVAVPGRAGVLVRATAQDAAAYGEPWDAGMKGQRASPGELAHHWAALLQDLLTLFVFHERPTRLLERSPRGKPLLYLFAEGERRAGPGAGVPVGLLSPPSFGLLKNLREMALLLPVKGEGVAAAAVSGRWEGTMDEKGVGERRIRLELRLQGGRLAGSLTTTVRQISMDIVLETAAYERGILTFGYSGGGGVRRFRATVQGAAMNGTIHGADGEEIGRFSLRFSG